MRRDFFSKFHEVEGKKNSHPAANVTTVEEVRASAPLLGDHSLLRRNLFETSRNFELIYYRKHPCYSRRRCCKQHPPAEVLSP